MNELDRRLWPFKPRVSMISAILLLVVLLLIVAMLRAILGWPDEKTQNIVFIGVFVVSLLPIFLALVDVIVERGGVIEYGSLKIDLAQVPQTRMVGIAGGMGSVLICAHRKPEASKPR